MGMSGTRVGPVGLALFAIVFAACGGPVAPPSTAPSAVATGASSAAPATQAARGLPAATYKFGYEGPLTGAVGFAGVGVQKGIQAAFDDANSAGSLGQGVKLELVAQDDANDQAKGIAATDTFLKDKSYLGLICCVSSSVTGTIKPLIDQAQMPTVITTSVMAGATEGGYMFRPRPDQVAINTKIVKAAVKAFNLKVAVVAVNSDNQGTAAIGDQMGNDLKALGVQVLPRIEMLQGDTDMSGPATKIIAAHPDAVFHAENSQNMVVLIRELRDRGFKGHNVGQNALNDTALLKSCAGACTGVPYVETYFPDPSNPSPFMKSWLPRARQQSGEEIPSTWFASGYGTALFLIAALQKTAEAVAGKQPARADLVQGMRAVKSVDTPLGKVNMLPNGQGDVEDVLLLQIDKSNKVVIWDGTEAGLAKN